MRNPQGLTRYRIRKVWPNPKSTKLNLMQKPTGSSPCKNPKGVSPMQKSKGWTPCETEKASPNAESKRFGPKQNPKGVTQRRIHKLDPVQNPEGPTRRKIQRVRLDAKIRKGWCKIQEVRRNGESKRFAQYKIQKIWLNAISIPWGSMRNQKSAWTRNLKGATQSKMPQGWLHAIKAWVNERIL